MMERNIRIHYVLRELNISLEKLADYLESKDITVDRNANAKINKEEYEILVKEFSIINNANKNSANTNKISNLKQGNLFIKSDIIIKENIPLQETLNDVKLFTRGNEVSVTIKKIIAPSQIVTEYASGYIGRLSLIDISWSFPKSEQIFKKYKVGQTINCVVFEVDVKSKQVILTQKHLNNPIHKTVEWERLERGDEFDAEIIQRLNKFNLVQTKNHLFGLVRKSLIESQSIVVRLKINAKFEESNLIDFVPSHHEQDDDFIDEVLKDHLNFIEEDLQSFSKLKKSLIGQNASDEQIQILKKGFALDSNIFSKELDAGVILFFQFLMNDGSYESTFKYQAIPYFLEGKTHSDQNEKELLNKLSNERYWFRVNRRLKYSRDRDQEKTETIELSLYNDDINFFGEAIISKNEKDVKFVIKNFSFGQSFSNATNAKKNNARNGSFLFTNALKISSPNGIIPFNNSHKMFLEYCLLKLDCFEIIADLKRETGEILKQEGRTLEIIDKFLEYQVSILNTEKGKNIFVEKFDKINSAVGGISVRLPREIGDALELEEGSVINVKQYNNEKLSKISDGFIAIKEDNYILNFYKDVNLELLANGFYADKRISTKQFDIQREIIKDFLEKKIKIDHIENLLVNPSSVKSPILKNLKFNNEDLIRTELEQPDNIQVRAVKKAVGNKNVFLIQGPPGTGKTTVIAEIIEQLTAVGEKILVSGQNHVAVDNVLEKIAKNPNLNLLRVGNPERVDKSLLKFCYENLVTEYKEDYKLFVKNQKKLAELILDFVKKDEDSQVRMRLYNEQVKYLTEEYKSLRETFKEKHYILRDTIKELSVKELFDTIQALDQWDESFNNESEILLQPIIYNSVDVVFATCIGIKGDKIFKESNFKFDTVIIDEAGKANIAETLVAIELGKKVILVGDQMQLPPYMDSSLIDKEDPNSFPNSIFGSGFTESEIVHALKTSFFEFLIKRIDDNQFPSQNKEMLNYQHRMHPNIGNFVSESFYGSKVLMGSRTLLNRINIPAPFDKEIIFFDTSNSVNPYEQKDENSIKNDTEAEFITEFILPKLLDNNINVENIAIIAPYKFQVANIKDFIKKSTSCQNENIDVATLDSFQGKEYDIIIFSFTRSSDHSKVREIDGKKKYNKVGFLDDARRLNVAFSRAKKKLILVGNASTLTDTKSHFDLIFKYTNLFTKLVELSKNDKIGNFINIADYHAGFSPFDNFLDKHKVKDIIKAEYRFIGRREDIPYGVYFKVNNFLCLLPLSFIPDEIFGEIKKYNIGREVELVIHSIDKLKKRVTLNLLESLKIKKTRDRVSKESYKESIEDKKKRIWFENKDNIKRGMRCIGMITNKVDYGYFVELENGLNGLLHISNIPKNVEFYFNQIINVTYTSINFEKQQISLKLQDGII